MNIVCPNCGTSYDVEASALGPAGRTVRCVRCRETWHARVDDMARADALVEAADEIGWDQAAGQAPAAAPARGGETIEHQVPQIESPPLAHDGMRPRRTGPSPRRTDAPAPSRLAPGRRGGLRKFAFGSGPAKSLELQPVDGDRGDGRPGRWP